MSCAYNTHPQYNYDEFITLHVFCHDRKQNNNNGLMYSLLREYQHSNLFQFTIE